MDSESWEILIVKINVRVYIRFNIVEIVYLQVQKEERAWCFKKTIVDFESMLITVSS